MKKVLLLTMLVLGVLATALAQVRVVTGKVTDPAGDAVPGAAVMIKGTTKGTVTDVTGTFKVEVPSNNAVLVIRFVGFQDQEVKVGTQSIVNVQMQEDAQQLDEVVVTAMGIERDKTQLGYSTQEVKGDRVVAAAQPNLTNALQGKVSGVVVRQSSGMPGASSLITVRGGTSIDGNNQPLYVIDGMPVESGASFGGGVSGTDASSRALDINPNDIESINVLKGPAAAALYGLRASNGVVVITTKKGKGATGRAVVTVNSNATADHVSVLPELQNTYAQGSAGTYNGGTSLSFGPKISEMGEYTNQIGEKVMAKSYDNVTPFFNTGTTYNNSVDVAGKLDNGNYAIGVGHTTQKGIVPTTGMDRYTAKIAGDFSVRKNTRVGASINFSDVGVDKIAGGSNLSNPLFTTYFAPKTFDLWGLPYADPSDPYKQVHYRGAMDNPRWSLANNRFNERTRRVFGNTYMSYTPLEWMTVNYRVGLDYYNTTGKEVYGLGSGFTGGRTATPSGGQINNYAVAQMQVNSNANITLQKEFSNGIKATAIVGNEFYDVREDRMSMTGTSILIGGFDNISNTVTKVASESQFNQRVVGFYANAELGYKDQIFLTASGRQDYVSNMPAGNRSFFYPSIGTSWIFTKTFEGKLPSFISFGKVRGSYAQVGKAGQLYATRNVFVTGAPGSGFLNDDIAYPFNGITGYTQSDVLRSNSLRPQNTATWEVGTDLKFWDNRISLEYTFFQSNTKDQIFAVPTAMSSGFSSQLMNAGELSNKGHELTLGITPVKNYNGFTWDLGVNFTKFENKVVSLAPGVDNIFLGGFVTPSIRAFAGQTYPSIYGVGYARDGQGRIIVDKNGYPTTEGSAKVIGQVQPDFEMNFSTTLRYKSVSLSAQIDWRKGGQMYAGNTRLATLYGMDKMTEDRQSDYIVPNSVQVGADGTSVPNTTPIKRDQYYWSNLMASLDEGHIYDAGFVRLREVVLNWDIPSKWTSKLNIRNASVYLTGRNLLLITDYPNFDPETSTGGASNFQGMEYVALPQTRSFGGGVKFSF